MLPSTVESYVLAHAHLLVRNGLVNEFEFLGLITQKW